MKTLYIVRHSKAVIGSSTGRDFERCLADRGREKAARIVSFLAQQKPEIDLIISSSAYRALETAEIFAYHLGYPTEEINKQADLYHFGNIDRVMDILCEIDDSVKSVMLFGHNPTFTSLAWHLCNDFRESMPTSAVAAIELAISSWANIYTGKGRLLSYLTKRIIDQKG